MPDELSMLGVEDPPEFYHSTKVIRLRSLWDTEWSMYEESWTVNCEQVDGQ